MFCNKPYLSTTLQEKRPTSRPQPGPHDDPFLESLFATMCQNLFVLPGETFVDQARRWTDALQFTAALKPRNPREWLHASDVTMKQFSAIHSLVMRKRRGLSQKQRSRHDQDFLENAKAMQDARLHYDLMRKSRTL
jgi:hypothetical protein